MSFSFVRQSVNTQNPEGTLAVATYELGACVGSLCQGIPSNASAEFADFISMLRMFCEQRGIDFDNLKPDEYACISGYMGMTGPTQSQLFAAFGRLVQCHHYDQVYGEGKHTHGPLERRIGHVLYLAVSFCRDNRWDFWELADLGEKRYMDRMRDITKYGLGVAK